MSAKPYWTGRFASRVSQQHCQLIGHWRSRSVALTTIQPPSTLWLFAFFSNVILNGPGMRLCTA